MLFDFISRNRVSLVYFRKQKNISQLGPTFSFVRYRLCINISVVRISAGIFSSLSALYYWNDSRADRRHSFNFSRICQVQPAGELRFLSFAFVLPLGAPEAVLLYTACVSLHFRVFANLHTPTDLACVRKSMEENSRDAACSSHCIYPYREFLDSCCFQIAFRQRQPVSRATHPLYGEQKPS